MKPGNAYHGVVYRGIAGLLEILVGWLHDPRELTDQDVLGSPPLRGLWLLGPLPSISRFTRVRAKPGNDVEKVGFGVWEMGFRAQDPSWV